MVRHRCTQRKLSCGNDDNVMVQSGQDRGKRTHNLEFDRLSLELNSANLKIDANCRDVTFCVGIICETEEEARLKPKDSELIGCEDNENMHLSDARVTNEKEFEKVVVLACVHDDGEWLKGKLSGGKLSGERVVESGSS